MPERHRIAHALLAIISILGAVVIALGDNRGLHAAADLGAALVYATLCRAPRHERE